MYLKKINSIKILLSSVYILLFFSSCDNDDDNQSQDQNTIEWTQQQNIPAENLRFNAPIITYNNEGYLLPGKGGSRFSFEPEILKFSSNRWTEIAIYDGFANAGNSGAFINEDLIYIVGGANSSNAPTDEVRTFSITENTFANETLLPSGASSPSSTASTQTRGYVRSGLINPETNSNILSYNFTTNIWENVPSPPINSEPTSSLMTAENNIIYILFSELETNNFFALQDGTNEWVPLSDFPGRSRSLGVIVSTDTNIYTGLGVNNEDRLTDIWNYDIESNQWIEFTQYPGTPFDRGFAFELNGDLFFGGGITETTISSDALNNEVYRLRIN